MRGNMSDKYLFVDLFAGAGGLSRGLEQAGFYPCFANEINPVCADTYYRNRNLSREQIYVVIQAHC